MNLKRFLALKEQIEELQRLKQRAKGAHGQMLAQLKKDFACSSVAEAKTKLARLLHDGKLAKAAYEKALRRFEQKWQANLSE